MNTHTPAASTDMQNQARVLAKKLQALRPFVLSMMITLTACCLSFIMLQARVIWPHPEMLVTAILGLMALNFLMVGVLEPYRSRFGVLTIPTMLSSIGLTIVCLFMEVVNRFVVSYSYGLMTPIAVAALALIYVGAFREQNLPMKLYLCANGLALTVLWTLVEAGRMALPF
jgi:hypothetical protein